MSFKSVPNAEDMTKMFESLGLGGGEGEEGGMGGLFPLMQVMLENILSKEVLYPPMKEITDKVSCLFSSTSGYLKVECVCLHTKTW